MSFFISAMLLPGLMSRPPVSKQMPLPTMVTLGACSDPQRRSISRGARSLARPTAWIMGKLSDNSPDPSVTLMPAPKAVASSRAAPSSSAGPRSLAGVLMRSRPKIKRLGQSENLVLARAVRQHQALGLGAIGRFVAAEAIAAGEKAEGGQLGIGKWRGEAIVARGQRARQDTGEQRGVRRPRPCRRCRAGHRRYRPARPAGPAPILAWQPSLAPRPSSARPRSDP